MEKKVRFWLDVWWGECPLKVSFNNIFKICEQQGETIARLFVNDCWQITFRRKFGPREMMEWDEIQECLNSIELSQNPDRVVWRLEKSGKFTARSLYNHILNPGMILTAMTRM